MDREQLRQAIQEGDAKIQNSIAWRMMSTTQRNMLLAGMQFWAENTPVTNAALDSLLAIYNTISNQ